MSLFRWSRLTHYFAVLLLIILAFSFLTRTYRLHEPDHYVFDEVYHAVTAQLIANNDPRAYEWWHQAPKPGTAIDWLHPPLAKYFQALGILWFGDNAFGWRWSSVVFGVLTIFLTTHLALAIFGDRRLALLAALLASFDGLLLVQSRIAMNDIHVTFFVLLTLFCYVRYHQTQKPGWLVSTGLASGLAIASKWSGVFGLVIVVLAELRNLERRGLSSKNFGLKTASFFILPLLVYALSYSQMFMQGKTLWCQDSSAPFCYERTLSLSDRVIYDGPVPHWFALHHQTWLYQTGLESSHTYQSRPWQWLLNLRPVWYYVDYQSGGERADIYALGNPLLLWSGVGALGISGLALLMVWLKKYPSRQLAVKPLIFIMVSYFLVWLPWQLSPRVMFFYHYTPAIPLLVIILAYWLVKAWDSQKTWARMLSICLVGAIGACFVIFYPHWTGLPVSSELKEEFYFGLESWR